MQFFRFWTRTKDEFRRPSGDTFQVVGFGYSNSSLDDALAKAKERAAARAAWISRGDKPQDQYYGGERPIREEIVEEFKSENTTTAIISRNSYGVLVLNTPNVFFADVDLPAKNPVGSLLSWFSKKAPSFDEQLIEKINGLVEKDASLALRLYRTLNGYRVVITSRLIPAAESGSFDLLKKLGSDSLYVKLCRTQDCYRARLTPKPWRCGVEKPPARFPFIDSGAEQRQRQWESSYSQTSENYATCALVGDFGRAPMDPQVAEIIKLHDHFALNGDRPLA